MNTLRWAVWLIGLAAAAAIIVAGYFLLLASMFDRDGEMAYCGMILVAVAAWAMADLHDRGR